MIIVAAATGEYGRLVVENLLERVPPSDVAVAVRNPGKAEAWAARGVAVRFGNYDQPETLRSAFEGADRLLFISGPVSNEISARVQQHRNVVTAAAQADVGWIGYTSGIGADMVTDGVLGEHQATEKMITEAGLAHAFLRHPIYHDLFVTPQLRAAAEAGELTSNTRGRGLNTATRADLAAAAAALLTSNEQSREVYEFTGPLWTYPQLADVLSEVSGRPVRYRESDSDEGIVGMLGLAEFIQAGGFEYQTPDLEQVLGHPASSLRDCVEAALDPYRPGHIR